ncbi:MAG: YgiT-type zinc finger protein [Methanosarcinales archaeon]
MIPCPKCGFGLKDTKIDYDLEKENITLHNVPALECPSCGYVSMNVEQADHFIELLERIRGVPNSQKITMHEKIISDGTRLFIKIPKYIEHSMHLTSKDEMDIWINGKQIVMERSSIQSN